jgi:NAD+ diphosphatase
VEAPGERARVCPECKLLAYPRLAPAVIMLLEREDGKALLARNKNFPPGMFSTLAGFVEPGETLEQAVRREILEEVGITVGKVEYRGSQPWPFPHQLMVGFGAWYESGDVKLDEVEIVEADWFSPAYAPSFTPGMSIAGKLIDEWRTRVGG